MSTEPPETPELPVGVEPPSGGPRQIRLPTEYVGSVQLQMMFSPSGPDAKPGDKDFQMLALGSAFVYETGGQTYLVTARHNLTGRHWQTNVFLGEYQVNPTHLQVVLLVKPPAEGWQFGPSEAGAHVASAAIPGREWLIPLLGENWAPNWKQHPTHGPDMDVAAIPVTFADDDHVYPWTLPTPTGDPGAIKWPPLAPGNDVFVVGYPYGLSSGPVFPLWIRGTIASDTYFGYTVDGKNLPLMLVDARTRKGQSGSVVIRHKAEGVFVVRNDGQPAITTQSTSQVIGAYSGRTSDESDLGYVWRIDEVDVLCRDGVLGTLQ